MSGYCFTAFQPDIVYRIRWRLTSDFWFVSLETTNMERLPLSLGLSVNKTVLKVGAGEDVKRRIVGKSRRF